MAYSLELYLSGSPDVPYPLTLDLFLRDSSLVNTYSNAVSVNVKADIDPL